MTRIFIAGDSTAAVKLPEKRPETGWGEKISDFFTEDVQIYNHAQNGRSTKSFIAEGRLAAIEKEIGKGDFLFVQFGHNDQKEDPLRGTAPFGDYQENLQRFADAALSHGATPIFLTSISRRAYLPDGRLDPDTLGDYPEAMRQFAHKHRFLLLDLFEKTQAKLQEFTEVETQAFFLHIQAGVHPNYPDGVQDNTHLNEQGASLVAYLVAESLAETACPLNNSLKKERNPYVYT